jgi:hypothetical protein
MEHNEGKERFVRTDGAGWRPNLPRPTRPARAHGTRKYLVAWATQAGWLPASRFLVDRVALAPSPFPRGMAATCRRAPSRSAAVPGMRRVGDSDPPSASPAAAVLPPGGERVKLKMEVKRVWEILRGVERRTDLNITDLYVSGTLLVMLTQFHQHRWIARRRFLRLAPSVLVGVRLFCGVLWMALPGVV